MRKTVLLAVARSIEKELNSFRKGDLDFEELQFDYPDYFDLKVIP